MVYILQNGLNIVSVSASMKTIYGELVSEYLNGNIELEHDVPTLDQLARIFQSNSSWNDWEVVISQAEVIP